MAHPKSSYNPIPSGERKDVSAKIQIQWEAFYCGARGLGTTKNNVAGKATACVQILVDNMGVAKYFHVI